MSEKENQRVMLTKRLLKESLIRLMSKKELRKITVSELCEDAGINRATFYKHYNAPYDLLHEIEMKAVKEIHDILIDFNINEPDDLEKRIVAVCRYLRNNRETTRLIFQNGTTINDFSSELIYKESPWYDRFFKEYGEPASNILMTFTSSGAYFAVKQWIEEDDTTTPEEMGKMLSSIVFYGISGKS